MGTDTPLHKMHKNKGFTLIEVLIAMVVLAIGMLGMSRITIAIINVNDANGRHTIASVLVQDCMESIKKSGYAGATNASSTEDYGNVPNYSAYKRVTTIASDTPAVNMKTVIVTVFWDHDKHSLSTTTILAQ
jgi:type IV pilus assembly protein PilV